MIVVADTSPVNYLNRIGVIDVLGPLYTRVLIPQTVADELKKEKAPAAVRTWIAQPPEWLEVLLVGILALKKFIIVGVVALVGILKKFFGRTEQGSTVPPPIQ
jgi:predicted nucleic acid-binding protein